MGASITYTIGAEQAFLSNLDYEGDTLRAMLVTASYEPLPTDDFVNSGPAANEPSGGNYARQDLPNAAVTLDDPNDRVLLDGDDLEFPAPPSGIDLIGCVVYQQIGGDDTTPGDDILMHCAGYGGGDIVSIDTASDELVVAGDETSNFSNGDNLQLHGHPSHDGKHTLDGAPSLNGDGDTVLPVGTDLTDNTVQGVAWKIVTTDGNKVSQGFASDGIGAIQA